MDGRAGDEQMADDELLPSAPEPDELEPADRFSDEIEEFIAERQALQTVDPNAWAMRRSAWDDMTLVFTQAGKRSGSSDWTSLSRGLPSSA